MVPVSAGCFLIPSSVLLPHPLSWRTEPLEQNLQRSLQVWTIPLMHTSKVGFGSYPQWQQVCWVSPWRMRSCCSTDLEHILFRNVLDSSFPFATHPFVLFFIYDLLKMSLHRALAMSSWNLFYNASQLALYNSPLITMW